MFLKRSLKERRARKAIPKLDKIAACFGVLGCKLRIEKTDVDEGRDGPYYPISLDWWKVEKRRRKLTSNETE